MPVSYTHLGTQIMAKKERKYIKIRGASEHNLKCVSLDIPRDEFVVFTGLSGCLLYTSRVIDESLIMILQKDAIIIDIASKPGGCDFEACKRYQINCTHALGLPGIYCPKTGAKILYDCMKRKGMTEGLWLFRIAP